MILNKYAIIADIGGTFARFGRVDLDTLAMDRVEVYACADYESLKAVLVAYRENYAMQDVRHVAIAIACPVLGDRVRMTNTRWCFSIKELKQELGLHDFVVLNDFNAIAMSLPALSEQQLARIGTGLGYKNKTRVVLGAGTGLGVAYVTVGQEGYTAHAGEGGHVSWGAKTEQEWFIACFLKKIHTHISYERLLSGQGLENLYQALSVFHQKKDKHASAAEIVAMALTRECFIAEAAVAQFLSILGAYAGDLALIFAAFGGVYIAGGIAPRLLSLMHHSDFRSNFEDKGRFREFNAQIPTYVVTAEQPGILGAAVYLKQQMQASVMSF